MELHGAVQYPDLKKKTSKKICYIFSEKAFLCLKKQNFLIISKKGFSYTPGNETFLYYQVTFWAYKSEKNPFWESLLYFGEIWTF